MVTTEHRKLRETIKAAIQEAIDRDKKNNALFNRVKAALMRFEGKKITKAMATAVQKELGESYRVHYSTEYGMYQLVIWQNKFEDRDSFLLGYDSNPILRMGKSTEDHSGIEYYCTWAGDAALERIKINTKYLLDSEWIEGLAIDILNYNLSKASLNERLDCDLDARYNVIEATKINI